MSTHIRNFSSVNFTARRILGFLRIAAAILAISGLCLIPTGCSDGSETLAKGKSFLDEKNYEAATQFFREAADCGNAEAMCYLGACYYEGLGVGQDTDAALRWWHEAAEKGNAAAMLAIARCHFFGHGVTKDFSEALKWIHSAAETGNPGAQCLLGRTYLQGLLPFAYKDKSFDEPISGDNRDKSGASVFVERDFALAVRMFRTAAQRGNIGSMALLALCYRNGLGVPKNEEEAEGWLAKAAETGGAETMVFIGDVYRTEPRLRSCDSRSTDYYVFCARSPEKAADWYLKAESAGAKLSADQMLCVADFHYGENKTEEAGVRYANAEEAGARLNGEQILRLADFYYGNYNTEEAGMWYEEAANAGAKLSAEQMLCIADFYYGDNNTEKAVELYEKAAEAGAKLSAEQMLRIADFYYGKNKTEEAGARYAKAEEAGAKLSAGQMLRLADFYHGNYNTEEAGVWYEEAANAGAKLSAEQMLRIADIYYRRDRTTEARKWYEKAEKAGGKLEYIHDWRLHQCKNGR